MPANPSPKPACCSPTAPEPASPVSPHGQEHLTKSKQTIPSAEAPPPDLATQGSTDGMVRIEGGRFLMGTDAPDAWEEDGEGPVRPVQVPPFYIDTTAVTNAQFARFIRDTGYQTDSERFGWSFVFHSHLPKKYAEKLRQTSAVQGLEWWIAAPGARWDRPFGERSDLKGLDDHPVVHVSHHDATAYAKWAGKRLPTEAEWEFAARGGREQSVFPWGDRLVPRGQYRCNTWQGDFPLDDDASDGFAGTCPVDAFKPNGYGLYNTSGNVWEWCRDWFSPTFHVEQLEQKGWNHDPKALIDHPVEYTTQSPFGPSTGTHRMQKGGSYLCHVSYCNRYRTAARTGNTPDSGTTNNGFRCVRDINSA